MRKLYIIFTSFLLASTIAFAEGDPGCEWETIEETETYLQEKCGDGMARIRSKPIDSTVVYVKSDESQKQPNKIVETPTGIETEQEIKKVEEAVESTAKKVKEIIEDFLLMIKEKPELSTKNLKEDEKTKLMCLSGVKQYPMRVKCATLAWHTLTSAIENKKEEINIEAVSYTHLTLPTIYSV